MNPVANSDDIPVPSRSRPVASEVHSRIKPAARSNPMVQHRTGIILPVEPNLYQLQTPANIAVSRASAQPTELKTVRKLQRSRVLHRAAATRQQQLLVSKYTYTTGITPEADQLVANKRSLFHMTIATVLSGFGQQRTISEQ